MMSVPLCVALLLCVCVCLSESCTCDSGHPQEYFCSSDIVMRAEVTGEKIIPEDDNRGGMREIQYEIKVIKVFKGSDKIKQIQHVYTSVMSSVCGTKLDHTQYLLSGNIMSDKFSVTLCDYTKRWDSLSLMMKNNFKYRYQMGCDCKIFFCTEGRPCPSSRENECVLTGWSSWIDNEQACIRHSDGSCSWFTGTDTPSTNHTTDARLTTKSQTSFQTDPL
ncbi:metalloproteinase inhibitor 2-like [Pseudorasbora parva]|uniref:metalloproteinase inhibitor 2-like n=1 Tax=Pseudorasbora parva TaxID=51549 RepID=UPI00351E79BA